MNDIPPKHTPEKPYGTPEASDGLVAVYNAASHASAESFPVLKAFQDYIEAERVQARRRVVQLSVFFTILMGVVVAGFLTAGMFMLRNMSEVQAKLLDVALASKESPPAPQPIVMPAPAETAPDPKPFFEASVREISKATAELRASLDKKMDGVSDIATKTHDRVAAQDSELDKLREELKKMQAQSEKLNKEMVALKNAPKTPPPAPVAQAKPPAQAEQAGKPAPAQAAAAKPAKPAPVVAEPAKPAQAVAEPVKTAATVNFPPAVKDPPEGAAPDVKPPPVPKGRIATAIPLKMKNVGTVPWRVMIPD
jgi:uncharacterized coiled-coil protein SlyX